MSKTFVDIVPRTTHGLNIQKVLSRSYDIVCIGYMIMILQKRNLLLNFPYFLSVQKLLIVTLIKLTEHFVFDMFPSRTVGVRSDLYGFGRLVLLLRNEYVRMVQRFSVRLFMDLNS